MSIKVKVSESSVKRSEKGFREAIEKTLKTTNLLQEIGEAVVTDIQFQTRRGNSIPGLNTAVAAAKASGAPAPKRSNFAALSKSWIKMRERIVKTNPKHPAFSKARSNLTITGELLNAIFFRPNKNKGEVVIDVSDSKHSVYTVQNKTSTRVKGHSRRNGTVKGHTRQLKQGFFKVGESKTNAEIAQDMADQGRPFMGIREQILARMTNLTRATVRRVFKSLRIDAS